MTMVVSLLTSLSLAITATPSLAAWFIRDREHLDHGHAPNDVEGGFLMVRLVKIYEAAVRFALRWRWMTLPGCCVVAGLGVLVYQRLESDFLPTLDERGMLIDYKAPPRTSLSETSRELLQAEEILKAAPEVTDLMRRRVLRVLGMTNRSLNSVNALTHYL